MNKILLAGPWIGELGWELFCWQAYIRKIASDYSKTIVFCRKGHQFLYSDFTDSFETFEVPGHLSAAMWMCEGMDVDTLLKSVKQPYTQHFPPTNIGFGFDPATGKMNSIPGSGYFQQKFIKYRSDSIHEKFDLIIHPRNKRVGGERNWDQKNWQELVDALKDQYSIAAIGNNESFKLAGVTDFRNIPIADTVALMNRCRLVVGQSSGPMHLAALSGAKHLVWAEKTNEERYKNFWNPLKTTCILYSDKGFNPEVDDIYNQVKQVMNKKENFIARLFKI